MIDILTQRVFYDVVGRTLLRGLVLPLLVFLLTVAVLDSNTDWAALRSEIAGLAPWQQSAVFSVLVLGWSWQAGRALRGAWRHRTIAFLVRQPIGRVQWALGLLPSLLIAFVPIAAIWWLAPHRAPAAVHYLGFVGLAWPLLVGASFTGLRSVALLGAGMLSFAALAYAYAHSAAFAYAALLVTAVQLPLSTTWIPREIAPVHERIGGHLRASSALGALVRRDLRCALRVGRKQLVNLAVLGIAAAAMMFAFRVNGNVEAREAFLTACVLFSVAATPVYGLLEQLKVALGGEIMRRRWPITHAERALALAGATAVLVGPGAVPLASASAGQRRKAELVCGLAGDPEVLLLDETFAHLDRDSRDLLAGWIAEWRASRLILLTHHGALPVTADAVLHVDGTARLLERGE